MSGIDEIKGYAPECPTCENSSEWCVGYLRWVLTEKSMLARDLKYPIIVYYTAGRLGDDLYNYVKCIGCYTLYPEDMEIAREVRKAFFSHKGKPYHKHIGLPSESIGVWEE
jgi:hypothetical protein